MKSFKEYKCKTIDNATAQNSFGCDGATAEELTKKVASAYQGKNGGDIFKDILKQAEQGKKAGTLTNEEIEKFYQSFAPMLNSSQRKKLQEVVEKLKQI